jgi:hypothetical protein
MDYLSAHLSKLRQEISELRELNFLYSQHSEHSPAEQTASDVRSDRLLQIKKELTEMRNFPPVSRIWWDKLPIRTA